MSQHATTKNAATGKFWFRSRTKINTLTQSKTPAHSCSLRDVYFCTLTRKERSSCREESTHIFFQEQVCEQSGEGCTNRDAENKGKRRYEGKYMTGGFESRQWKYERKVRWRALSHIQLVLDPPQPERKGVAKRKQKEGFIFLFFRRFLKLYKRKGRK